MLMVDAICESCDGEGYCTMRGPGTCRCPECQGEGVVMVDATRVARCPEELSDLAFRTASDESRKALERFVLEHGHTAWDFEKSFWPPAWMTLAEGPSKDEWDYQTTRAPAVFQRRAVA